MDYVSGTSDAALNSSSPSHVSSHQIQRQKESFSPSAEQLGLKIKFCAIHQPSWPGQGLLGMLKGAAWPGAAKGPGAAALMSQDLLQSCHLASCPLSPPLLYFLISLRRQLRVPEVAGGCGSALGQPPPPQPPPSQFSRHTPGIKDKL